MDIFGTVPLLESDRLLIRRPGKEGAPWVRAMASEPEVYRYLPGFLVEQKFQDKIGAIEYIESYRVEVLGAFRKDVPNELIGMIEIYDYDPEKRVASVGYRFRKEYWGAGYGSETLGCVLKFLWKYVDTVTAHVMVENEPSKRVLLKNGFKVGRQNFQEDWDRGELTWVDEFVCSRDISC